MPMHRLNHVTIGVPNLAESSAYYRDFGLAPSGPGAFSTADGGEQLYLEHSPRRRLIAVGIGIDDPDDLSRIQSQLSAHDFDSTLTADGHLIAIEPTTGVKADVSITPRMKQATTEPPESNGPGRDRRLQERADGVVREGPVRPRKLGHVVIGSPDVEVIRRFFIDGLGLKVSDEIDNRAAFLRCSTDHHNIMVQQAPVAFLHHTSWQVDDVDEIGRGATTMLEQDPSRHVWGLGRHLVGSNYFWYLKDPAGNFSEYYSDLDVISEDQLWKPEVWHGSSAYYAWGPDTPPSFIHPDDLTELMAGLHPG